MKRVFFFIFGAGIVFFLCGVGNTSDLGIFPDQEKEEFNPFAPKLPDPEVLLTFPRASQPSSQRGSVVEFQGKPEIEGVMWGTDTPQAIIDGNVYSVGDILLEHKAEIIDIKREGITLKYEGRKYFFRIKEEDKD